MKAVVVEENRKLVLADIAMPKIEDGEDVLCIRGYAVPIFRAYFTMARIFTPSY
nr:hypothetical protein [Aggregatibacter actinomycetemcomitans]